MMKMPLCLLMALALSLLVLNLPAHATPKNFVIAPFTVNAPQNYAYLSKAVPGTLQGKLNQPGVLNGRLVQNKVASQAEARKLLNSSGADYAVWGTVNITGNEATIAINSLDRSGKIWNRTEQSPVSSLTSSLQRLSSSLGSEAFGLSGVGGVSQRNFNNNIVVNETGQNQVYLNPQFRYQGAGTDGSRLRTQRLKDAMLDMAVGDFNGDGKNEIAVLSQHKLYIYDWGADSRLKPLGEQLVSQGNKNFILRTMDLNKDRIPELIVNTYDENSNRPYTFFFSFKGNHFSQYADRAPYFVSVVRMPPSYAPTLVCQKWDSLKLFMPGVHLMVKNGSKFEIGGKLDLPAGATAFNFCWLPGGKSREPDRLIMLREDERLKLYGKGNSAIYSSMEKYSGSAVGMQHFKGVPGLGVDRDYQLPSQYYAPMRMICADLGHTGEYVLLINKPISTASQFFERYRYFPQGEIHALFWDGVGLGLKWKTRRIRGSVAQIDLADANNDGILDLVVGLNTSPELGIGGRQSMLTAYPLDVTATNPNVPADLSDFEVNPNY